MGYNHKADPRGDFKHVLSPTPPPFSPCVSTLSTPSATPQTPKISIVIPVFNAQSSIKKCLESCISQSFTAIEILIIDDKGQDNSIAIAQTYARNDPRIRIIHNPQNIGTFHARIQGIKHAHSPYICFLDADDYLHPNTAMLLSEKLSCFAKDHQGVSPDIIYFGTSFFPPSCNRLAPKPITQDTFGAQILKKSFLAPSTPPWHIWAKLYKKDFLQKANDKFAHITQKLIMAEDALHSFVIATLAHSSTGITDKLYYYCENTSSITRRSDPKTRATKIAHLQKIIYYLQTLQEDKDLSSHPYFHQAHDKICNILNAAIELEHRYDDTTTYIPAYLKACFSSLKHYHKWQTYARIFIFIASLGKIKI
ncbi:hypothetical protein BKH46_01965 [Helicobacter sp. 12S02634-8]|uniref:glycosyltransferase family 2 protein n=1 Tax=Helicobacter sp. 12S02634-8 TaxID=1476199 RepID=UPI000BA6F9E6|nr:glycosyltransferase family 2 protein [Helicobacter sp. 12S02634-8]PAF48101.1 hypothetical protein BKH46_01965 [Helicobacter sp. 12S02634-8]